MEKLIWSEWESGTKCKCGGSPTVGLVDTGESFGGRYWYVVMCEECSRKTTKCTNVCDAKSIWNFDMSIESKQSP